MAWTASRPRSHTASHTAKRVRIALASVVLGAGVLVVAGEGPAIGQDERLTRARAICDGPWGIDAKVPALHAMAALESRDGRAALETYAESRDGRLAGRALLAIGRAGYDGSDQVLRRVFEDARRPHAARAGALLAYVRQRQRSGASWEAIESDAKRHLEPGSRLATSLADMKNAFRTAPRERR